MYLSATNNCVTKYHKEIDSKFVRIVECCDYGKMKHNKWTYLLYIKIKNHQKYKIAYVTLDTVSDYVYIAELNTRLCVG